MNINAKTGSDIEATRPVLWYNRVPCRALHRPNTTGREDKLSNSVY